MFDNVAGAVSCGARTDTCQEVSSSASRDLGVISTPLLPTLFPSHTISMDLHVYSGLAGALTAGCPRGYI